MVCQNACLSHFRHAQAEVCDVVGGMEQHHITSRIVANFAEEINPSPTKHAGLNPATSTYRSWPCCGGWGCSSKV